jgi:UDP-glucose:(heptosyl)LPS alpha-1,3-glucosyltransferase
VTIVAHDVEGSGGMERQLRALVTRLLDRGLEVTVVSRTFGLNPHPLLRTRRVPGPARPFALAYPWFAVAASLMLLRRRAGPLHATGAIVLNRAEVCTVHYVHQAAPAAVLRTRRATLPYRLNAAAVGAMSRAGERLVYGSPRRSATLVAVSDSVAGELERAFPGRAGAIRTIPNGVDSSIFRPDPDERRAMRGSLALAEDAPVAVFVGSEWRGKGAFVAVEALAAARSWHLIVLGRGDAGALRGRAEELRVSERLHVVGETETPELWYAAADALVLPSLYESFSLVALEAASTGVPVVATRVGVIPEIVHGGGGILVERTPAAVASALRKLEWTPGLREWMGARAMAAASRYDWDAPTEEYVSLYR